MAMMMAVAFDELLPPVLVGTEVDVVVGAVEVVELVALVGDTPVVTGVVAGVVGGRVVGAVVTTELVSEVGGTVDVEVDCAPAGAAGAKTDNASQAATMTTPETPRATAG